MDPKTNSKEWYRFAEMYAKAASFLMNKRRPPYEVLCYLECLSAECAMKGFLLEQEPNAPLPDAHNLRELCQACARFEAGFFSILEGCRALGRFATPSGFPTFEIAVYADALRAMDTSRDVLYLTAYSQEQKQGPTMTM